MQNTQKIL